MLFTGDTLLKNLKSVIILPDGDKNKLIKSLKNIQDETNVFTKIYPGHGEPFFLSEIDFGKII
jgi:glyoxylase-like metal-dependent hydrolase (beta-lactamase superfamily II)